MTVFHTKAGTREEHIVALRELATDLEQRTMQPALIANQLTNLAKEIAAGDQHRTARPPHLTIVSPPETPTGAAVETR